MAKETVKTKKLKPKTTENKKDKNKFKRKRSHERKLKKQKVFQDLFLNEHVRRDSLPNQLRFQNNATFILKRSLFNQKSLENSPQKDLRGSQKQNGHSKDFQTIISDARSRRGSRAEEMVSRNAEANSKGRTKGLQESKPPRRKPHSLPPLPRTPKSPMQETEKKEAQNVRRLIGSPPPTGLLKRVSSGSFDIVNISKEHWRNDSARSSTPFREGEHTVYSPNSFLESSQPKITLKMAPKSEITEEDDEHPDDRIVVRTASSTRSLDSLSSLILSTKSLNLNSSLTLPPRLLSYQNEDGTTSVQEWVPEGRLKSAPFRRSSTPSIRDLPTPLQGVPPLEVTPKSHPNSKNSKRKLKPLKKR